MNPPAIGSRWVSRSNPFREFVVREVIDNAVRGDAHYTAGVCLGHSDVTRLDVFHELWRKKELS